MHAYGATVAWYRVLRRVMKREKDGLLPCCAYSLGKFPGRIGREASYAIILQFASVQRLRLKESLTCNKANKNRSASGEKNAAIDASDSELCRGN
ncbi:hypothetical protein VYU27_000665 [Nannochloropsis oceanica]